MAGALINEMKEFPFPCISQRKFARVKLRSPTERITHDSKQGNKITMGEVSLKHIGRPSAGCRERSP